MTSKEDFGYFLRCLAEAGPKMDAHYFQIEVAGSDNSTFRERVYCYELYHQLRNALEDEFPYKLDGEIDKAGHPSISGAKKPDFVVHEPGEMNRNLLVVEVKSLTGAQADNMRGLSKDLDTLQEFVRSAKYHRGVMLVYSDGADDLPHRIISKVEEAREQEDRILLVWHRGSGESPEVVLG